MKYLLCVVFLLISACGEDSVKSESEECFFSYQCTDDTICVAQGSGCSKDIESTEACTTYAEKIAMEKKATLLSSDFSGGACSN